MTAPLLRELAFSGSLDEGVRAAGVAAPAAAATQTQWHVSPAVDVAAYHFSWLWALLPMLLLGHDRFGDYLPVYAIVLGANFAHRHYGLPYAYLDREVFAAHRRKLVAVPLLCLCALALTPGLRSGAWGAAGKQLLGALVFFSVLWNLWHVYMQKYGILRVYMAKAQVPAAAKTPGWVDKFFVLCWFPLYFSYLGPTRKQVIFDNAKPVRAYTTPIIEVMEAHQAWLVLPSAALVAAAILLFVYHDFRAHRLRNRARLSAAIGLALLSGSLLWIDPIKVYLAFGFSHAIEYMVFVWAYQRKRYAGSAPSPMQRLMRHPLRFYGGFTAVLAVIAIVKALWGRWFLVGAPAVLLLGMSGTHWFRYYTVFESLLHFHMDGYLWKMRRPDVRANL